MKTRTITILKTRVYEDIDSLTYKYAEVSTTPSPKQANAISSDVSESLDGHLLARNAEFRDTMLRTRLQFALAVGDLTTSADDSLSTATSFTYELCLPDDFKDSLLQSLAVLIHRYIVWGALYDWYAAGMGSQQAGVYNAELKSLETQIVNLVRSSAVCKRPMQPFGPAKRYF